MYYLTDQDVADLQTLYDNNDQQSAKQRYVPKQGNSIPFLTDPIPQRAILLQDLYGGSQALAQTCVYKPDANAWFVEVLGINPVPDSSFKLVFSVSSIDNGVPTELELFRTPKIPVVTDLNEMLNIIIIASGGIFTTANLKVSIGNPFTSEFLQIDAEDTEDADKLHEDVVLPDPMIAGDLPKSYVGAWLIYADYSGQGTLQIDAVEDPEDDCFMRGLSIAAIRRMVDVPAGELILVRDIFELARPNPARAGVKVGTLVYPDVGHGVICVGYRDFSVDIGSVAAFEDPPEA